VRRSPILLLILAAPCAATACKKASEPLPIDDAPAHPIAVDAVPVDLGALEEIDARGEATNADSPGTDDARDPSDEGRDALEPQAASDPARTEPNPSAPAAPAGNVEFLAISADGGTDAAALQAALAKAKQRFRGCYGRALASDGSAAGTLKLRLLINADGSIGPVNVAGGNVSPGPLVQCSVATTKSLKITPAAAPSTRASFDVRFTR
jgi:hypothetical protein